MPGSMFTVPSANGSTEGQLPAAVHHVAEAVEKGTNGLGSFAKYANLSFAAVFLGLFVWWARNSEMERRELVTLLRESNEKNIAAQQQIAAENRTAQDRRFDRTEGTHAKHMEKMGMTIERAVSSMESATRALEKATDKQTDPDQP